MISPFLQWATIAYQPKRAFDPFASPAEVLHQLADNNPPNLKSRNRIG